MRQRGLDARHGLLQVRAHAVRRLGLFERLAGPGLNLAAARLPDDELARQLAASVDGAINVPVGELASRIGELRRDAPTAVMCEGGYRSALAASLLQQEGFARLANVTGGMAAFREVVTR